MFHFPRPEVVDFDELLFVFRKFSQEFRKEIGNKVLRFKIIRMKKDNQSVGKSDYSITEILRHLHAVPYLSDSSETIGKNSKAKISIDLKKGRVSPAGSLEGSVTITPDGKLKLRAVCLQLTCLIQETMSPSKKEKLLRSKSILNEKLPLPKTKSAQETSSRTPKALLYSTKHIPKISPKQEDFTIHYEADEDERIKKSQTGIRKMKTLRTEESKEPMNSLKNEEETVKVVQLLVLDKGFLNGNVNYVFPFKVLIDKLMPATVDSLKSSSNEECADSSLGEALDDLSVSYTLKVILIKKFNVETLEFQIDSFQTAEFVVEPRPVEEPISFSFGEITKRNSFFEFLCGGNHNQKIETTFSKSFIVQNDCKPLLVKVKANSADLSEFTCCTVCIHANFLRKESMKRVTFYKFSTKEVTKEMEFQIYASHFSGFAPTIHSKKLKISAVLTVSLETLSNKTVVLVNHPIELIPELSTQKNMVPLFMNSQVPKKPFGSGPRDFKQSITMPFSLINFSILDQS